MRKLTLFFGLLLAVLTTAQTTVSIRNQKMEVNRNGKTYILAPNGDDASYFWASVSPDGKHLVYVTARYGTFVCDINGENVRSMGRMNAPKWLDDNHISGMQEFYKGHDEIDYIRYISRNINDHSTRELNDEERTAFIQAENLSLEADRERHAKRIAARKEEARTDFTGLKIYINPGHGGYDGNDRSVWTIPVPAEWTDSTGYWESKSNLVKGLALRDMLEAAGAEVIMSRTTNNSGERDIEYYPNATAQELEELQNGDDRDLGAIGREASDNDVDHFISIHSNALGSPSHQTNYLLILYRGYNDNPQVEPSDDMAKEVAPILYKNPLTTWSSSEPKIYGDVTFYGEEHGGLGVLKLLTVPGFLTEGSFHDYAPETHRLMSKDYCRLEALRMFHYFHKWFNVAMPQTATISGTVKSSNETVDEFADQWVDESGRKRFKYIKGSNDQWLPLNGAKVELYKGDSKVAEATTDEWYNGVFAFYDLEPGTYKLVVTKEKYETITQEVTVKAEEIAGVNIQVKNTRLQREDFSDTGKETIAIDKYVFEAVGDKVSTPTNISRALYRNGKYYFLTNGEIKQYSSDFKTVNTIPAPADVELSDIGFTADDCLVAKVKDAGIFYTWDDKMTTPTILFEVEGIKGNSFAVSGARWGSKYYLGEDLTMYVVTYDADKNAATVTTTTVQESLSNKQLTYTPTGEISSITGASFMRYANCAYMAKPVGTGMNFQLFDVTGDTAKDASEIYPSTTTSNAPYAATMAWVEGYIMHVVVVAEGIGMQHFQNPMARIANIYAGEVSFDEKNFSFRLNEDAADVIIAIERDGKEVASQSLGALKKGMNKVENPFAGEEFDAFTITATARPIAFPIRVSTDDKIFQFYASRGVAVDRTPSSPFFGRIYVGNCVGGMCSGGENGGDPAPSYRNSSMGIFVLGNDFTDVTNQGNTGWLGDIAWGENQLNTSAGIYEFAFARPAVAPDGDVFVTSTAVASSGVYIMNPAAPEDKFVTVFEGRRNKDNGQILATNRKPIANPVMHCCILGTGKDEVLYTFDRDKSTGKVFTSINQYNLGELEELPWKTEPSAVFYDDTEENFMENGCGQIAYDQRGGFFMSQYRANSSWVKPALLHVNKDGEWDFNISNNGVDAALQGGMALNQDGSLLAMGTEAGMVKLWSVEYDEEGAPSLTEMYTINWGNGAGNTMGVDFDAAGNLYIVSNSNERLMVYALPNAENTYTTRISLKPTTDVDNITTNQEVIRMGVYSVLGQYLGEDESGLPHGMYIINGKKVIK